MIPSIVKLQTIYEIWKALGFRLPFIVQQDCWKEGTFFVVRRIPYRGSEVLVFGDLYRGGQFIKSREGDVLPLSNRRVWVRLPFSWMPCVSIEARGFVRFLRWKGLFVSVFIIVVILMIGCFMFHMQMKSLMMMV